MDDRRSLVRRAVSIARSQGLPGIARGLGRSVFWVRRFYLLELSLEGRVEPEPPAEVVVRRLADGGLGRLGRSDLRTALERRLRLGDDVLVAELEGRVVGWIWLARCSPKDDPDRTPVTLAEGEVFADGLMVLPDARRRGVATALLMARNALALALGANAVLSLARRSNAPVLGLQRRFGTRIRALVVAVVLLGRFRLVIERPPSRRMPEGFSASGG